MPKPIDMIQAFAPKREAEKSPDGGYIISVTPPAIVGLPTRRISLTADQYRRYQQWLDTGTLIQDCLPDLDDSERELLMTGLSDADFEAMCGDDDEA